MGIGDQQFLTFYGALCVLARSSRTVTSPRAPTRSNARSSGASAESPGISVETLRREVADSEPVKHVREELTQAGLLVEESAAKRLRRLWIFGGLLAALGIARLIAAWSDGAGSAC